jgi:hypothetical protein
MIARTDVKASGDQTISGTKTFSSTISGSINGNAATATALQTARTINGTSFNATANITTANWGTARTLTIGNTGKSVNGSGNVSWSLAEIGAYAATNPSGYTSNTGTVTSVATGSGLTGGTITTSGTLSVDSTVIRTTGNQSMSGIKTFTQGGGAITITNSDIRSNATSNWTGDPGTQGKIQYHSNRWYIVSDSSSNRIVQFRRNGSDVSHIDNSGVYNGNVSGNATTATTLQTTRSINGTNFNGSANITTANWGTTRTIFIGSTGKSVNGSGNVSWSVAELGARPASNTGFADRGYTTTGARLFSSEFSVGTRKKFLISVLSYAGSFSWQRGSSNLTHNAKGARASTSADALSTLFSYSAMDAFTGTQEYYFTDMGSWWYIQWVKGEFNTTTTTPFVYFTSIAKSQLWFGISGSSVEIYINAREI